MFLLFLFVFVFDVIFDRRAFRFFLFDFFEFRVIFVVVFFLDLSLIFVIV